MAREQPDAWRHGVVQNRIGINDLGTQQFTDLVVSQGLSDSVRGAVLSCIEAVQTSVQAIRSQSPDLRIVLVGILNNSDWPPYFDLWQTSEAQANINAMLDSYDDGLIAIAESDRNTVFFDDRAWFRDHWGGRDDAGLPAYRKLTLSPEVVVSNTQGDSPENAIISDGHAGTLVNAVWAQDFVRLLIETWLLPLTPVTDKDLVTIAESLSK